MQYGIKQHLFIFLLMVSSVFGVQQEKRTTTVPVILDHNRMLVEVELQRKDSTWRTARLWIDSGNPGFFISESLANDLGIDFSVTKESPNPVIQPLAGVRIGGMKLNFDGINTKVTTQPFWLFSATHNEGNLPSTLLKKYHIVFDYPNKQMTIAEPGTIKPRGTASPVNINPKTGVVQMDAVIDGEKFSFALDNGASYSFVSEEILDRFSKKHKNWPWIIGAIGCANMWGWWPRDEQVMLLMRVPEIKWGEVKLEKVALVGVPKFSPEGPTLGEWYSQKTARAVDGFLGPNAFKSFRVEIDYKNSTVYFEKGAEFDANDLEMIGLTLKPQSDGSFQVIGVTAKNGKPIVEGIEPGDFLIQVGDFKTLGATLGSVVNALRGKPGEERNLLIERNSKQFKIKAKVYHQL